MTTTEQERNEAMNDRLTTYAPRILEGIGQMFARGIPVDRMMHISAEHPIEDRVWHVSGDVDQMLPGIALVAGEDLLEKARTAEPGCMRIVLVTRVGSAVYWCKPELFPVVKGGDA
jgi:hypothetical protein